MADNTQIKNAAGGTETIADDDITGGVADGAKVQRVKAGFGIDGAYVDVSTTNPLPITVGNFPAAQPVTDNGGSLTVDGTVNVGNFPAAQPVTDNGGSLTVDGTVNVGNFPATQPVSLAAAVPVTDNSGSLTVDGAVSVAAQYAELTGSASANNTDLIASTDVRGYTAFSVQVTGSYTATVTVQVSNDGTTWVEHHNTYSSSSQQRTQPASLTGSGANQILTGSIYTRYLRVRTTSYGSGTPTATLELFANGAPTHQLVWLDNATGIPIKIEGGINTADGATNQAGQNACPTYPFAFNGTTWDRTRSFGTLGAAGVTPTPGTTGGWTPSAQTALTNTKVQIKGAQGCLGGYMIYNPNTSVAHVQVFDALSASVTVGTTAPTYVLSIPPSSAANLELTCGAQHATGITVAATTTPTGSTAPASALVATIFYK